MFLRTRNGIRDTIEIIIDTIMTKVMKKIFVPVQIFTNVLKEK